MDRHLQSRPVLIGTVALDILHSGSLYEPQAALKIRWGGVMSNMACALGVLSASPVFISASYEGEIYQAAATHLSGNNVEWIQLNVEVPMPMFHAQLLDGSVTDEHFIGLTAFDVMTPALLDGEREIMEFASVISTCTDLPVESLVMLSELAASARIPYWVLVSDTATAAHLNDIEPKPSCVALNVNELTAWSGVELEKQSEIVSVLWALLPTDCRALVTLGASGSLLVTGGQTTVVYQPSAHLPPGISSVGAGDVMFGSMLAARLAGEDWPSALASATARTASYLGSTREQKAPYRLLRTLHEVPQGMEFAWR